MLTFNSIQHSQLLICDAEVMVFYSIIIWWDLIVSKTSSLRSIFSQRFFANSLEVLYLELQHIAKDEFITVSENGSTESPKPHFRGVVCFFFSL